jgi:ribonuclease BN (tRNA processing enzyme)
MDRRQVLVGGVTALAAAPAHAESAKSRLILLGTAGGPTPKLTRAAPANAVVVNGQTYVVDCGNGVARQLVLAGLKLGSIRAVFVTHHHSDHDGDYGNLLSIAWASDLAHPVDTYGPPPLKRMTAQFTAMNRVDLEVRQHDEGRPPFAGLVRPHEVSASGLVMRDANVRVTTAVVDHGMIKPALAYRFDCPDRSIVFSGDTRPSDNLIALARGADILVHEVMYLPAIEALIAAEPNAATLRRHLLASHTTTAQVGRVATAAGVKTLVLTHFVPGGAPIPDQVWENAVRPHFAGRIVVGRDLMEL